MKSFRCRDDGEMYEKGLTPTIARASPRFLHDAVHFASLLATRRDCAVHFPAFPARVGAVPCTSRESLQQDAPLPCTSLLFLQPAVHFARFLAAGRALAMHFVGFLARGRALLPIPCKGTVSCKERGEVHGCSAVARPACFVLFPSSNRAIPGRLEQGKARRWPNAGQANGRQSAKRPGKPGRSQLRCYI